MEGFLIAASGNGPQIKLPEVSWGQWGLAEGHSAKWH